MGSPVEAASKVLSANLLFGRHQKPADQVVEAVRLFDVHQVPGLRHDLEHAARNGGGHGLHLLLRRDAFYLPFRIPHLWRTRPDWAELWGLVRLGVPMGGSILVEVTGFTFMAFFIARLGATPVAGHQIAKGRVRC